MRGNMDNKIENKVYDEERALYNIQNTEVANCLFAGPADGESALKEARNIVVRDCSFSLRYPLWHTHDFLMSNSVMDEATRAPIWYSTDGKLENCQIDGIKCLRECRKITMEGCKVHSPEFGWRSHKLSMKNCEIESEYFLFECTDVEIDRLKMKGKYSFQYIEGMRINDSELDTKDAFWHSKNVTVENSTLKGEYLAWYSDGLTLVNCHIIGTQPLCYCTNLKLINCTMEKTDLSFEYSDVEAEISGEIMSVKNPRSGYITADKIGEIVLEDSIVETTCEIREKCR